MHLIGTRRGQALVETTLFLPLMLIALFAIVYFGRYGVLDERAQAAIRYGSSVSFMRTGVYSVEGIYQAMDGGPSAPVLCASTITADTAAALTESAGGSGSSAQPYWSPDLPASSACTMTAVGFGGPDYMAFHYFTVVEQSLQAGLQVPTPLQSLLGKTGVVRAQTGFVHADPPGMIMYCSQQVGLTVSAALGFAYSPPNGNPCG